MNKLDELLAPISSDSPTGEDAKYEFCYEMMEAEIKKFGSLFGETTDWTVVNKYAVEVLLEYSKDLKAFCYLVRSMAEVDKIQGLQDGLLLLRLAIEQFGANLHPRRKRGRDGAMEWLSHQLHQYLSKIDLATTSWDELSRCQEAIDAVQSIFSESFQDSDADLYEVKSLINGLLQRVNANETASSDSQSIDAIDSKSSISTVSTLDNRKVEIEVKPELAVVNKNTSKPKSVNELDIDTDFTSPSASRKTLKKVAETLLNADSSSTLSYRIHRYLTWFDIDEIPEHQNNVTALMLAISQDQQAEYKDKAKQESDVDSIRRLERTLTDAPFWLTGHFYVHCMLKNLDLLEAAKAVTQEVQEFVNALPGIETLSFKNAIPFADDATLEWLSSSHSSRSNSRVVVECISDDLALMDDITLDNFGEKITILAEQLLLEQSGRGQFISNLQMVRAYHAVELFPLCLPYLEKSWSINKEMDLPNWEPHLSLQLDSLTKRTLMELYPEKELLPAKYQEWELIYN